MSFTSARYLFAVAALGLLCAQAPQKQPPVPGIYKAQRHADDAFVWPALQIATNGHARELCGRIPRESAHMQGDQLAIDADVPVNGATVHVQATMPLTLIDPRMTGQPFWYCGGAKPTVVPFGVSR